MSKKTLIISFIVVAFAVLVILGVRGGSKVAENAGVYCSSAGILTDKRPIQSHRSYCVQSDAAGKSFTANTPNTYAFSVVDDQGNILQNFEITHTKPMHVIVVRKDLKYFQHVHPQFTQQTGKFTLSDLTFPTDGQYRIFADFAPSDSMKDTHGGPLPVTISEDISVGNAANYIPEPLGSEERVKIFNGIDVTLDTHGTPKSGEESMLMFTLSQNGKPVTDLQEYLGALGHSVILREGTLDFIHAHPMEDVNAPQNGKVDFMVNFPEGGKYKVFTQFQRGGKVFTSDFVVSVDQGVQNAHPMENMDMNMPGMDHSKMGH